MAEKACHDIRRVDKYVDSQGREVLAFVQVFGKDQEPTLVKGAVMLRVGVTGPGGVPLPMPPQNIRLEWSFPEGTSVKKAFEMFDEVAKVEVERFKADQAEKAKASRVVGARAMPPILGANGKAIQSGG